MEKWLGINILLVVVFCFGFLCFIQAQDVSISESESFSVSVSASLSPDDKRPCSFRGKFLNHRESTRLDPCTECRCMNGTTTCEIISCPAEVGCAPSEIVVISEECCPQCPLRMYVADTQIIYDSPFEFYEGMKKKIKFDLSISVDKRRTTRLIRGENLWKLGAWIGANEDGSGERYSLDENIFSDKDAAQEYNKPSYPPWEWFKLKYTMDFRGGTCDDFKFFCVEFNQGDDPRPIYDLLFTFQPVDNEQERLIDCIPLGACKGLTATDLDWELEAPDPTYGVPTPVTLDIDATFTDDSADRNGEGLWRVGIFGSPNEDGSGTRIGEVYQTLDESRASKTKTGTNLEIDDIRTNFEIGTIGCTDTASFVCVEFTKGDLPDPDFTMSYDSDLTSSSGDSLIKCKPQECSARAIFSTLVPDLTGERPVIENQPNTIRMDLNAITDKDLSTSVPGSTLWELGTFFNKRPNGKGPRIEEQTQILNPFQQGQDLILDENLVFNGIEFQTDLTGVACSDIPYICFELKKNEGASLDYVFGTNPTQDPFVECIDFSEHCEGVIFNGIIWDRKVPDHIPGDPVPLTINAAIEVDPESRGVTGDDLYEMSVFVAADQEGNNRQTPSFDQVLTPGQMATNLPPGGPLVINGIQTPPVVFEKLGCGKYRYLCVEFRKNPNADPDYTAKFAQSEREIGSADDNVIFTEDSLIQCRPEKCPGDEWVLNVLIDGSPRSFWRKTKALAWSSSLLSVVFVRLAFLYNVLIKNKFSPIRQNLRDC